MRSTLHVASAIALLAVAYAATAERRVIGNSTGLPAYPNLSHAAMESHLRVEALGRQCVRFVGQTGDSLAAVQAWYRTHLTQASETDLANDELFANYVNLSGIKLSLGVDYVAIFVAYHVPTTVELHRCGWNRAT